MQTSEHMAVVQQPAHNEEFKADQQKGPMNQVELDHSIGYSGKINDGVHLHTNGKDYALIAGCSVVVRDIQDPHNQHFMTAHDDQITCLAVSNSGHMLASGQRGENSDIVCWDFNGKKPIYRLSEHDYEVVLLRFSHDDRLLLSCGNQLDGRMFIWNTTNGHIVSSVQLYPSVLSEAPRCAAWGGFVKDVKLRSTTNYQFSMSGGRKLVMWQLDPVVGQCSNELVNTGMMVREYMCMTYSKNQEDFLYAGTTSGDLCGFQVKNKIFVFSVNLCAQGIKTLRAVSGSQLAVGGGDGQVVLLDTSDNNTAIPLFKTQNYGAITGLSASPDGIQLMAATDKGFIYRIRCSDFSQMLLCESHTEPVLNCWFMPGVSDKFITTCEDGTLRLWDANDYSVVARCNANSNHGISQGAGCIHALCAIFTDEVIISGWSDGYIRAYRVDNCSLLWQIQNAHKGGVTAVCLASNYKFVCSGGMEGEVRVWEVRSRELVSHLKEHTSKVTKIELFNDDVHLLTCARDRSILCWDLKSEKRVSSHTQRMGGINSFAVAPNDNNKFISVGQERKITFWDLRKANAEVVLESSPFKGESDELHSVSISHNNKYFAVGGSLGIVRIFDFTNGQFITEARAHSSTISCVAFSDDDKQLISTGRDGLVAVWNVFLP